MPEGYSQRLFRKPEIDSKLARLRERMSTQNIDGVVIRLNANLSWLTAGTDLFIFEATDTTPAMAVVTHDRAYIITDTIEEPRLRSEMALGDLGFQLVTESWHSGGKALGEITRGLRMGQDGPGPGVDFGPDMQRLRSVLQPEEITRARQTGILAGNIVSSAIRQTQPGESEQLAAARLAAGCYAVGGQSVVVLVASDERIFRYRHPLPTLSNIERYVMLVLCMRHEGLIVSVTRIAHWGPLPDEIAKKAEACARIDAALIVGTRPGRTLGDMFELARTAYQDAGYPEAIDEHHQGGSAAYLPREVVARPGDQTPIVYNQLFAWNPSIRGVKSEDTVLVREAGFDVLTATPDWPTYAIEVDGQTIRRPQILVL